MTRIVLAAVLLTALVCAATVVAAQQPTIFKSDTDLVVLHVSVFDERSDAVPNLPQQVFRVFEDDTPQQITFFTSADMPVAVGLILDSSSSMIARRRMVRAGGDAFVRASHPEDELFTIHFNEHVEFGLPPAFPFTSRPPLLMAALARYRPGGKDSSVRRRLGGPRAPRTVTSPEAGARGAVRRQGQCEPSFGAGHDRARQAQRCDRLHRVERQPPHRHGGRSPRAAQAGGGERWRRVLSRLRR